MTPETQDRVNRMVKNAANTGEKVADKAAAEGSDLLHRAADTVGEWADQSKKAVQHAGEKVQHWAEDAYAATSRGAHQAYDATAKGVHQAYDATAHAVEPCVHRTASMIRQYPITSVVVGLGLGWLIGRAMRA
jgi:ElaB/YqjD/DUF883 family membrane-anchored ribosome-binding protein